MLKQKILPKTEHDIQLTLLLLTFILNKLNNI